MIEHSHRKPNLLKLKARDAEDTQVVSAVLQDSIAPVCDMIYRTEEKNFIMVVHRLRREAETDTKERVCCAINLSGVEAVQTSGIDLNRREDMLDLLAILPEPGGIQFVFAGGGKIRARLSDWSMIVEDFGDPWPALCNPCHDAANAN